MRYYKVENSLRLESQLNHQTVVKAELMIINTIIWLYYIVMLFPFVYSYIS